MKKIMKKMLIMLISLAITSATCTLVALSEGEFEELIKEDREYESKEDARDAAKRAEDEMRAKMHERDLREEDLKRENKSDEEIKKDPEIKILDKQIDLVSAIYTKAKASEIVLDPEIKVSDKDNANRIIQDSQKKIDALEKEIEEKLSSEFIPAGGNNGNSGTLQGQGTGSQEGTGQQEQPQVKSVADYKNDLIAQLSEAKTPEEKLALVEAQKAIINELYPYTDYKAQKDALLALQAQIRSEGLEVYDTGGPLDWISKRITEIEEFFKNPPKRPAQENALARKLDLVNKIPSDQQTVVIKNTVEAAVQLGRGNLSESEFVYLASETGQAMDDFSMNDDNSAGLRDFVDRAKNLRQDSNESLDSGEWVTVPEKYELSDREKKLISDFAKALVNNDRDSKLFNDMMNSDAAGVALTVPFGRAVADFLVKTYELAGKYAEWTGKTAVWLTSKIDPSAGLLQTVGGYTVRAQDFYASRKGKLATKSAQIALGEGVTKKILDLLSMTRTHVPGIESLVTSVAQWSRTLKVKTTGEFAEQLGKKMQEQAQNLKSDTLRLKEALTLAKSYERALLAIEQDRYDIEFAPNKDFNSDFVTGAKQWFEKTFKSSEGASKSSAQNNYNEARKAFVETFLGLPTTASASEITTALNVALADPIKKLDVKNEINKFVRAADNLSKVYKEYVGQLEAAKILIGFNINELGDNIIYDQDGEISDLIIDIIKMRKQKMSVVNDMRDQLNALQKTVDQSNGEAVGNFIKEFEGDESQTKIINDVFMQSLTDMATRQTISIMGSYEQALANLVPKIKDQQTKIAELIAKIKKEKTPVGGAFGVGM